MRSNKRRAFDKSPLEDDFLILEAQRVLSTNRQEGVSQWKGQHFSFVCPSLSTYPFQWFWDSAFHAIALLHLNQELAKQELRCMLHAAQPDGFIPHIVLWQQQYQQAAGVEFKITLAHPYFTATTQPPVIARAIERVFEKTRDLVWLTEVLEPTVRFFDWLQANRDPDGDFLLAIIQPDESGLDVSSKFDGALGIDYRRPNTVYDTWLSAMDRLFTIYRDYRTDAGRLLRLDAFNWEDVAFNSIYADGLQSLARLCRVAQYSEAKAAEFELRSARVTEALISKCWDQESCAFWDLNGLDERPQQTLTSSCLFPLILKDLNTSIVRKIMDRHLLNESEFWLPFPIPSVAANEPSFDPGFETRAIFRGPSWVNMNWYLYWGLRQHGYEDIASELAHRTVEMIKRGGMRECFNPYSAEGYGATDFGWTALVIDLLAAEKAFV
jgi:glycogen debranching enzyme